LLIENYIQTSGLCLTTSPNFWSYLVAFTHKPNKHNNVK
jgi:hypothetical protein